MFEWKPNFFNAFKSRLIDSLGLDNFLCRQSSSCSSQRLQKVSCRRIFDLFEIVLALCEQSLKQPRSQGVATSLRWSRCRIGTLVHFDQMHPENGCISSHYGFAACKATLLMRSWFKTTKQYCNCCCLVTRWHIVIRIIRKFWEITHL